MDAVELETFDVRRRGLSLPEGLGRRGCYELRLGDGRRYAGRTDDIVTRVGGHARTYGDIEGLSYWPVAEGDLDVALSSLGIGYGAVGRWASAAGRSARRPERMDPGPARVAWLETKLRGPEEERPPEVVGQREWTRPKFERLAAHPAFERLVELVRLYVERMIPAPKATERDHWVITSVPSTATTRVWHRLLCLSVNNVEAMTIGEQVDGDRRVVAGFVSAALPAGSGRATVPVGARRTGAFLAPAQYATVGAVAQIGFDKLDGLEALLASDRVLDLVGELVMRLMDRGRGLYGRFHDYNLADVVLGGVSGS